jgi:glycosyltransferase involved in cell wall biosynthesis
MALVASGAPPAAATPPPPPRTADGVAGAIDIPIIDAVVDSDLLVVHGWAMVGGRAPASVELRLDGRSAGPARLGIPRPDLAAVAGVDSFFIGFESTVRLDGHAAGDVLEITALAREMVSGIRHHVATKSFVVGDRAARTKTPAATRGANRTRRPAGPHVLAVTHRLDYGGGQLYLRDLVRGLVAAGRHRLTVLSPGDGPLRAGLEKLGVAVHVSGSWSELEPAAHEGRLREAEAWARAEGIDAVLVNTLTAFSGACLAQRLGVPCIWAVHESYPLPEFWLAGFGPDFPAVVRARAESAMRSTDRVVFEAAATRDLLAPAFGAGRSTVVPYGIPVADVERRARAISRDVLRAALDASPTSTIALCMGTIEPRKSQSMLLRAFIEVADRHPEAVLVLVGDHDDYLCRQLHQAVATSGLGRRVHIVPITPDPLPWYVICDLLVSASDVESMPRSAMEAMACARPVLAADCFGVAELIDDGVEGWTFPPRDLDALVTALDTALSVSARKRAAMGAAGRERVREQHDAKGYVAAYLRLLDELLAPAPRRTTRAAGAAVDSTAP